MNCIMCLYSYIAIQCYGLRVFKLLKNYSVDGDKKVLGTVYRQG